MVSLSHASATCGTLSARQLELYLWAVFNTMENTEAYLGLLHLFQASVCRREEYGHFTVPEGLSFQYVPSSFLS